MKCPVCFSNIPKGASSCGQCGNPVRRAVNFCSNCGQNTEEHWKNCKYCGNPLIVATGETYREPQQNSTQTAPEEDFRTEQTPPNVYRQQPHRPGSECFNEQNIANKINSALDWAGRKIDTAANTAYRVSRSSAKYSYKNYQNSHASKENSTTTNTSQNSYNYNSTTGNYDYKNSNEYQQPPQGNDQWYPGMFSFTEEGLGSPENHILFSSSSRLMAMALAIFVGVFGVHNFYLGYHKKGVIQLLLNTCFIMFGFGPFIAFCWAIYDVFCLAMHRTNYTARGQLLH